MKLGRMTVLLSIMTAALSSSADVPGVYALTNGVIHPVSGPEIRSGTVVIRGGLIEAVGADVPIPPEAAVIDVAAAHVYPGLIDAHASSGFGALAATNESDRRPREPTAATVAAEIVSLSDDDINARRVTGVTTIVAAPDSGIFAGQSAVLNLNSGPAASRVVRSPAAMNAAFRRRPTWTFPDSLMGVVAYMRQSFLDAQHLAAARLAYEKNPAQRRPDNQPDLEALSPVLARRLPLVVTADSPDMIRRARAIAKEFNLRLIIAGARAAYPVASELRDVPVLVSVDWPSAPSSREDREEQPLRVIRDRVEGPSTPSLLARSGARFALVSGSGRAAEFIPGIRKSIEAGLSPDDALRAVTLTPAQIFGVDRQLGSLERGKIANVVVTDRPIFEKSAKVTRLFVDGLQVRTRPAVETTATSPINGTWNLSVRTPQETLSIIVTLRAESGHVSGSFAGDRGSGDISGGIYDSPTLQFTITARMDAETADWVFRGTVRDDAIEGTVSTQLGTFQFTGSRAE